MFEAEFWVAVAFVIFVGVLIYFKVHKMAVDAIDGRRARIEAEQKQAELRGRRPKASKFDRVELASVVQSADAA